MSQADAVKIVTVDATNVAQYGFFCYKSKPKSEGYRRKLDWLEQRFLEGLKIKIVHEGKRAVGFIEYIPGEFAWRAVEAEGYLLVHCIWVVGRGKKKGYGSCLLNECVEDARQMGKHGVAMVASSGNWLAGKKLLLKNGFESVDQAPPSFSLLVKRFGDAPLPSFPTDWEDRLRRFGPGLTIIRSNQCPYIESVSQMFQETAAGMGIQSQVIELKNCQEVQESAPSPYGVFNLVYDGKLVAYHWISEKAFRKLLEKQAQ
jgi:ribosomal protein S18 acetylase RimI-like enzyme